MPGLPNGFGVPSQMFHQAAGQTTATLFYQQGWPVGKIDTAVVAAAFNA